MNGPRDSTKDGSAQDIHLAPDLPRGTFSSGSPLEVGHEIELDEGTLEGIRGSEGEFDELPRDPLLEQWSALRQRHQEAIGGDPIVSPHRPPIVGWELKPRADGLFDLNEITVHPRQNPPPEEPWPEECDV